MNLLHTYSVLLIALACVGIIIALRFAYKNAVNENKLLERLLIKHEQDRLYHENKLIELINAERKQFYADLYAPAKETTQKSNTKHAPRTHKKISRNRRG